MTIQLSDRFDLSRLFRFTLPSIVMMLVTSIYSVVDGLFVSNLVGDQALAAVNIVYPLVMIVGAFGFMLGAGGSYLSFVTGNISNLKLPCALNALEQADVKANSEEGEIVSTVAIAVSSIVTTLIIILGVILIIPLTPVLESPALAPAFAQILPALFGGLGVVFISKNAKLSVAPICLMLVLFIFVPALNAGTVGIMVPVSVLFTVGVARILYKKGIL